MVKRGPDGCGEWVSREGRVALAHRRLSIIDLSSDAAQPMTNKDESLVLSFNGRAVQVGSSAAILGNPLRALVAAARFAALAKEPLQPGWIVMAGGATAAEALAAGTWVEHDIQDLGRVAFSVTA